MSLVSYLAYPVRGKKQSLMSELSQIENCEVIPSINREALVLVAEGLNPQEARELEARLSQLKSLQRLAVIPARQKSYRMATS